MIAVMRMLARGGSRRERVRGRLMAAGAALATFLLCVAVNLLQARDARIDAFFSSDGRALTSLGLALLILPAMAFLYQVSRLAGATRERRLAALRLAGATPRHVRLLGAYEGGWQAALGGLIGIAVYLMIDLALSWPLPLTRPLLMPAILVAVTLSGTFSGLKAGRHVVSSPLGVVRRAQPTGPRVLDLVLVTAGVGALAIPATVNGRTFISSYVGPIGSYGVALIMAIGMVLLLFGLVLATAWLIRAAARWVGRRARAAETLLAARLVEADPRGWARALSVVGLTVFFGSMEGAQQGIIFSHGADEVPAYFMTAYLLIDIALLIALATSAAALVVHQAEALLDHRRSFAALAAAGAPVPALGRVLIRQALTTSIPVCLVAALAGVGVVLIPTGAYAFQELPKALIWGAVRVILTVLIGVVTAVLVARAARPLLRRALDPDELRTE
ncbi:FtsX-like permease family protein [Nonomuraea guangzhouensis]|uniref:FtsX-like permease family protein n=1 Tax=Nonomuraea guangzhouensis TaxID=1291555 RepID=A0ABW4GAF1_9ACTN|nr:FtsX-like permease family protein [Nonomuraea guangzhouensis]